MTGIAHPALHAPKPLTEQFITGLAFKSPETQSSLTGDLARVGRELLGRLWLAAYQCPEALSPPSNKQHYFLLWRAIARYNQLSKTSRQALLGYVFSTENGGLTGHFNNKCQTDLDTHGTKSMTGISILWYLGAATLWSYLAEATVLLGRASIFHAFN